MIKYSYETTARHASRLAAVLRAGRETVSIDTAVQALGVDRRKAIRLLSQWTGQGCLTRVGPGLYVPVPLDLAGNEQVMADPWYFVPALFGQAYIGGWTAAHGSMIGNLTPCSEQTENEAVQ